MKKIKGLDTLRAFAIFFVIIGHFGVWFDETSPSGNFIRYTLIPGSDFGVLLFFVLSGFLITSILLNAKNEGLDNSPFLIIKNFFIRRALRIFPIYYLLLFALALINYPDIRNYFWYFATYTSNILVYHNQAWNHFSHTWTLAVEEQFYLVWPWLIIFAPDKYTKYVLFGAILTGIISSYYVAEIERGFGPMWTINSFDSFGIGGLYAWARLKDERCKKFESAIKIIGVFALLAYCYWKIAPMYNWSRNWGYLIRTVDSIIAIWLIVLVVNNRSIWVGKYFLSSRFLNYMGKISYGLYLYHYAYINYFLAKVNSFINDTTINYPQANKIILDRHYNYWLHIIIMVAISAISYQLIEKPILTLKTRFKYNERK